MQPARKERMNYKSATTKVIIEFFIYFA